MNLQPVLTPCKRSNADLHIHIAENGEMLEIYWGTALLQRIPYDSSSMLFRIMAGVLVNLGFPFPQLEKAFPVCDKTLRKWGRALKAKTAARMLALLSGHTARRELSPEQEQYVQVRYSELKEDNSAYREKILNELFRYWKKDVTGELLRPLFREVDREHCPGDDHSDSESADNDTKSETVAGTPDAEVVECTSQAGSQGTRNNACAVTRQNGVSNSKPHNDCSVSKDEAPRSSESEQSSELSAQESDSGVENSDHDAERSPFSDNHPESEGTENSLQEPDTSADTPGTVTAETCADVDSEGWRNNACAQTVEIEGGQHEPRNDCSVPPTLPARAAIDTAVLHGRCRNAIFSHHAGLFTLLPWLQPAVGEADPMIQQFALQVLAGASNWEQSRQLDFEGLKLLCPKVLRTPRMQSRWFKDNAFCGKIEEVFRKNAALINMSAEHIFYFDPHTERYTGKFKTLLGWCGSIHGVDKALHLDFIHTENGDPCYVRHFDNYEDMRQRFLISREQFRSLFPGLAPTITWATDRGIWSVPYLQYVAELGDTFATWEKDYIEGTWNRADVIDRGRFTKWRIRNSRGDRRKYKFRWFEQHWDKVTDGRRFIVQAVNPEGRCIEVSIVTNAAHLSAEKIVWLMFNRWVQENDFAYLERHFGIGELTERGFDYYSDIADELEDRQQESRRYKRTRSEKKKREKELSEKLLKMRPVQDLPTLEELYRQEEELQQEVQRLKGRLNSVRTEQDLQKSHRVLDRVQDKVNDLKQRFRQNASNKERAEKRDSLEAEASAIEQNIEKLQNDLHSIPRTESRIQALIDEEYVRLKMRSKPLADAVRITARNVFIQPLRIFRGIWDNRRNDHAVLRAITRSAGFVIPHANRLEVVLYPQLDLQPAEWRKVYQMVYACESKIKEMQNHQDAPEIKLTLCTSNKEMMSRVTRQG